jgi:hypothetical protein
MMTDKIVRSFKDCEILCYHRIVKNDIPIDVFPDDGLSISVGTFENHLDYFLKRFDILDIKKDNPDKSRNGRRKIIITFDDGYRDIVETVIPIIEKKKVPIVVFLSTAYIEDNVEFCWWIDLWNNLKRKDFISFTLNNQLTTFKIDTYNRKLKCYNYMSRILIEIKRLDQIAFFIENNLDINYPKDFLTTEDIKELSSNPLVTLEYHSHYHLNYSIESDEVIEDDIKKMELFFNKYSLKPDKKLLAFCYGKYSKTLIRNKEFDYYFALGYRALLAKQSHFLTSRINVNSKSNLLILTLRIYSFWIFKFISKYF